MIKYNLACKCGETFESWFSSSSEFDSLCKKKLIKFISEFHNANKVIACICSAVQLLISAKIVKGKKIAGYYSLEDDITNAGAIYTDKPAVIDGKIITTAHYKDMGPWMKAVLCFFNEK